MYRFLKRTARIIDGQLTADGPRHLRVGAVRALDDWTAIADVVDDNNLVVQQIKADRHTGVITPIL